jgi:oxalate---CoA ligase
MIENGSPSTLLELLRAAPASSLALILPETGTRMTYSELRQQVGALADAFASAASARGDRIALALPNGLPAIAGFLAAPVAGTAALLNPGYRYDEFRFY